MPIKDNNTSKKLTPMMEQYKKIKENLPSDVILLFRLGDFYELFLEDAVVAAPILNVALTKRNGIPMCGVPCKSIDSYSSKLINSNKRIAFAEQTSDPQSGKIVNREIKQIISSGTIDDLNLLDSNSSNYLASVFYDKKKYGISYIEYTTGEFKITEIENISELKDEISRINPKEILCSQDQLSYFDSFDYIQEFDSYSFIKEQSYNTLLNHFKVQSLDGFGCDNSSSYINCAGAILDYIKNHLRRDVNHIQNLQLYNINDYLIIDTATQSNLELITSQNSNSKSSLFNSINFSLTPMGSRLLKNWILYPIRDINKLNYRQDFIKCLIENYSEFNKIRDYLSQIKDIERTINKLSKGNGNPRDLKALEISLSKIPNIKNSLISLKNNHLSYFFNSKLEDFSNITNLINKSIKEEPPLSIKEGGIFKDNFNTDVDELRKINENAKELIANLQIEEQRKTGISSLKIKYNNIFGYFIEITKLHLSKVPENYIKKQTLSNVERFITPELKDFENKIIGAEEKLKNIEYKEFISIREKVLSFFSKIHEASSIIAKIDVLASLAQKAKIDNYVCPIINKSQNLIIKEGRHPILDSKNYNNSYEIDSFVPNDINISNSNDRFMLITGPNMAGKSTYIKQVALISILAHMGSFVPAESSEIGLIDRIFSRVGAHDNLSKGQSTFMVEMFETSLITNNATNKSLIILDEIGRGTATYDGLSIAWSVAEYLNDEIKARCLFTTHYHELTNLSKYKKSINNYFIAVKESGDDIIFLRKIMKGIADKSYGIHVAKLAGIPKSILDRAKEILTNLEKISHKSQKSIKSSNTVEPKKKYQKKLKEDQMTLF